MARCTGLLAASSGIAPVIKNEEQDSEETPFQKWN